MKKTTIVLLSTVMTLLALSANAGAPYDITVTFDPPITGGAPDGYNLYIDDCAATGATGAAFASVTSGQQFVGAIQTDGTFLVCVRAFNAAGEVLDPGPVATLTLADLPLPGEIQNLQIAVDCPLGGCTINVSIN